MRIKISISLITISQLLVQFLLFNYTQINLNNLISCTIIKTNLEEPGITLHLN